MSLRVECYRCGRSFGFPRTRCRCGEGLWFEARPSGLRAIDADEDSIWRYRSVLPVGAPVGLSRAVGRTPLLRTPRLDAYAGCPVSVKVETLNPTGSFKDRGSAVGVGWAAAEGNGRVGTVSHGNMARSMAACSAAAGLDCLVLVPADIPAERLGGIGRFDPSIRRVDGDYADLYDRSLEIGARSGVTFVNSDTPLRVAGQRTTAFEIAEHADRMPDAVVLPTSSGGHASAVWRGFQELEAAGRIDAIPRLCLVQARACDPIARAYRDGGDVRPVEAGETVAYSIANPDPPSGDRALAGVRATAGAVCSVGDDAILEAVRRYATHLGLAVEPAAGAGLAGVRALAEADEIGPDEDVVAVATGTGLVDTGAGDVEAPVVDIDDLDTEVAAWVGSG